MLNTTTATAAARAVDLTKTYGTGDVAVRALDGVNVELRTRPLHGRDGTLGVGQVDADALHGRARHADVRSCLHRRRRDRATRRRGADQLRRDRIGFVFQSFNLVPTLTAARTSRSPPTSPASRSTASGSTYLVGQLGIARPPIAPSERAVRRPAAAGRVRAGADRPPRADLRRRADRQPRLERLRRGARVPAPLGHRARSVDRDGDPRPAGGRVRRPGRVPGRREGRG